MSKISSMRMLHSITYDSDVMRNNMLVNQIGLEGRFMPVDLNIEHLNHFLKVSSISAGRLKLLDLTSSGKRFFTAKGVYASWDQSGISAAVDHLQHIRKQVGSSLGISYHGLIHTTPDTDSPVQKISYKVNKLAMHVVAPPCHNTNTTAVKPVVDALAAGERKLKSSTLSTFNRKVQTLLAGKSPGVEAEEDEIPPASFDFTVDMDAE